MSLILEALKKSEKERQAEPEAQVTSQAPWEVESDVSRPRRLWPWLVAAILIVVGGTGGVVYLRTASAPPPALEVATSEPPAEVPASLQPAESIDEAQENPAAAVEQAPEPPADQPVELREQAEQQGSPLGQVETPAVTEEARKPTEPAPAPQPVEAENQIEDQASTGPEAAVPAEPTPLPPTATDTPPPPSEPEPAPVQAVIVPPEPVETQVAEDLPPAEPEPLPVQPEEPVDAAVVAPSPSVDMPVSATEPETAVLPDEVRPLPPTRVEPLPDESPGDLPERQASEPGAGPDAAEEPDQPQEAPSSDEVRKAEEVEPAVRNETPETEAEQEARPPPVEPLLAAISPPRRPQPQSESASRPKPLPNPASTGDARRHAARAQTLEEQGLLDMAIAEYDRAIELDPDFAEALVGRAWTRLSKGEHVSAILDFDAALKLQPQSIDANFGRGWANEQAGRDEQAIADYTDVIGLVQDHTDARFSRGFLQFYRGRLDLAAIDFEAVSVFDGSREMRGYAKIWHYLSLARRGIEAFELIATVPDGGEVGLLGEIFRLFRNDVGAVDVMRATKVTGAEARRRNECIAYFFLGQHRLLHGDPKGAAEYFNKAVDTNVTTIRQWGAAKRELWALHVGQ